MRAVRNLAEGIEKENERRVRSEDARWLGLILRGLKGRDLTEDNIRDVGKHEKIPREFIDQLIANLVAS